ASKIIDLSGKLLDAKKDAIQEVMSVTSFLRTVDTGTVMMATKNEHDAVISLASIIESMSRIGLYATDIAEITIDRCFHD
ncbi:MAG: hypothetical protein L6265_12165, partial [Thermoplasmatales archaeon]|nr:hypothetical protein [Thermoplasmatales archaeon]